MNNSGNPSGYAKHRVCTDCKYRSMGLHCPATRKESQWVYDATGKSRTVSGGICGRTIENYGRPVAA